MKKQLFMASYNFHVPISTASLTDAFRRSGKLTVDDAYARIASVNYHHWRVEDPATGAAISSADPTAETSTETSTEVAKECDV
jgi:hypothetical protein